MDPFERDALVIAKELHAAYLGELRRLRKKGVVPAGSGVQPGQAWDELNPLYRGYYLAMARRVMELGRR